MYSVSEAYLTAFRKPYRKDRITGRIKLINGTNLILSNDTLVQGGFAITRKVCGSSYDIGTFNATEMSLSLRDDAAKELDFGGAVMAAEYELMTGGTNDNPVWETVPLGTFYIDGQQTTRRGKNITLRGFDATSKFDIDPPPLNTVTTLWDGLVQACLRANVGNAVDAGWFSTLPNASITPDYTSKKIQSCRDLVMWIAQAVGCCAFIDRNGFLQLKHYYYGGDGKFDRAIIAAERTKIEYTDTRTYLAYLTSYCGNSPKLYQNVTGWTGTDTVKEGGLSLPNNPLLSSLSLDSQDAANEALMGGRSYPTRYIKSTGFIDPAIDLMDVLAFTGGTIDIGQIISVCTEIKWKYRGTGHIVCNNIDQYSEDADTSTVSTLADSADIQPQDASPPVFAPTKSQLEKRVDALEATMAGSTSGAGLLASYEYVSDNSIKYNGMTYTVVKDDTGLITKISDSEGTEFSPEISGTITDVAFHNAVLTAVALLCGLPSAEEKFITANMWALYDINSLDFDNAIWNNYLGDGYDIALTGGSLVNGYWHVQGSDYGVATIPEPDTIYLVYQHDNLWSTTSYSSLISKNMADTTQYYAFDITLSPSYTVVLSCRGAVVDSGIKRTDENVVVCIARHNDTAKLYVNGILYGDAPSYKGHYNGEYRLNSSMRGGQIWDSPTSGIYRFVGFGGEQSEAVIIANSKYLMKQYGVVE
jgi:hypothetical protein